MKAELEEISKKENNEKTISYAGVKTCIDRLLKANQWSETSPM